MNAFTSWLPAAASGSAALVLGLLAKITVVLALAWIAHLLLRVTNPRWRILLWRAAGVGVLGVAVLGLREPLWRLAILPARSGEPAQVETAPPASNQIAQTTFSPAPRSALPPMTLTPITMPENPVPISRQPTVATSPELTSPPPKTAPEQAWSWWHWTLLVWAVGVVWGIARMIVGMISLARIRRTSSTVPAWIVDECSKLLGGAGRLDIRRTGAMATPCSIGILRNTILLPSTLCEQAHRTEIRAALGHEIAHFRGHDLHWNGLLHVLSILLWFHPCAWRMRLAHADACDQRCDAEAARQLGDSSEYGRTLARLALQAAKRTAPVALSMARQSNVSRRIAVLRSEVGHKRLSRWRAGMVASLVGSLLLGIGAAGLAPSRAEDVSDEKAPAASKTEKTKEHSAAKDATEKDKSDEKEKKLELTK